MTWPVAVLWGLIAIGALSRGPLLIYLFSGTAIFGGLTMVPSGVNVPPQALCAALLILRTAMRPRALHGALEQAADLNRLGFLVLFGVYAAFSAIVLPRLFAGSLFVFPLNDSWRGKVAVAPTAANLNEAAYILLSVGVAVVFAAEGGREAFRRTYLNALLLGGALLCASGLVDEATALAGHPDLLRPFHNASYALLTDVDFGGQKRIVGFMPEASAFGGPCVAFLSVLVFCFDHFPPATRRRALPAVITGLAAMAWLSTSSTAFIGIIVLVLALLARFIIRGIALGRVSRRGARVFGTLFVGGLLAMGYLAAFAPHFLADAARVVDLALFEKTNSSSYLIRSGWNHAGIDTFWQTYGIGVGVGSVRTSNWYVNILASTGVAGVLLFAAAAAAALRGLAGQGAGERRTLGWAIIWALAPIGAMMAASGTTPDPGVFSMALFGLLAALGRPERKRVQMGLVYSE